MVGVKKADGSAACPNSDAVRIPAALQDTVLSVVADFSVETVKSTA